jgi:hypothetical protein
MVFYDCLKLTKFPKDFGDANADDWALTAESVAGVSEKGL